MKMKICSTCKQQKTLDSFTKDRSRKDGLRVYCSDCSKVHREKSKDSIARWRSEKSEEQKEHFRKYYMANRERQLAAQKIFRENNPDIIIERRRKHYAENRDKVLAANKAYRDSNKETVRSISAEWHRKKFKECPVYAISIRYRSRVRRAIRVAGFDKNSGTGKLLGCTWEHLKSYLEERFSPGMGWHNMKDWHIDHIIPLSSAKTIDELGKLCHFSNLQPLWAEDNIRKGASMNG